MPDRLVHNVEEACRQLGDMSRSTLYTKLAKGELVAVKIGRRSYITQAELERYVSELPTKGTAR